MGTGSGRPWQDHLVSEDEAGACPHWFTGSPRMDANNRSFAERKTTDSARQLLLAPLPPALVIKHAAIAEIAGDAQHFVPRQKQPPAAALVAVDGPEELDLLGREIAA